MLLAGWVIRIGKNCDRGLESFLLAFVGLQDIESRLLTSREKK